MHRSSSGVRSGGRKQGTVRKIPAARAAASQRNPQAEHSSNGMYSDQIGVAGSRKRPVRERLHGISDGIASVGRQSVNKRQRQEDGKWKHDLYADEDGDDSGLEGQSGTQDLRLRLTRKNPLRSSSGGGGGGGPPMKDLREKLSGPIPPPVAQPEKPRHRLPSTIVRGSTAASASVAPPRPVIPRSNPPPPKIQPALESVASFLTSLGLEKYLLTFQAEEVDMTALRHMKDEDLKELNVPMGPRKKILLALGNRAS
ncbi:hypothetical protein SELMODRAFT_270990 [Selaginella moellendorffii]|uniref:SAM domain-containing protein n=1 Tax=Selaginella moellendorffii TaxID=88036 RepID=D8RNS3_SELML|nr:uncharacterized protein LOC9636498 isoform X1 [Selaginella moellendorffii]EFJ26131.1 hypothetical protein SELMODRAFT_270990 [Selaginella moellendorffii]|eukprot:XP_002972910.1 uncharacterized protein LOC9636498 isoform X1 [Selaginella moellendorffii]